MTSRWDLERRKKSGFSDEDYAEWLRQGAEVRASRHANEMDLQRMKEEGSTGRTTLEQESETERHAAGLKAELPVREAQAGYYKSGAEMHGAQKGLYGTQARAAQQTMEFAAEAEPHAQALRRSTAEKGELDVRLMKPQIEEEEYKAGIRKFERESPYTPSTPEVARPGVAAAPGRKLRPGLGKALWEGQETKYGNLPGLGAPAYGLYNLGQWLGHFGKKGYEWAFPYKR